MDMPADSQPSVLHRAKQSLRGFTVNSTVAALFSGQALNALSGFVLVKAIALYIPPQEWGLYSLAFSAMTLGHALLIGPVLQSLKTAQADYSWRAVLPVYIRILTGLYLLILVVGISLGSWLGYPLMAGLVCLSAIGQGVYSLCSEYVNLTGRFKQFSLIQASYGLLNLVLFGLIVVVARSADAISLWVILALLNGIFAFISGRLMKRRLGTLLSRQPAYLPSATELLTRLRLYITPLIGLAIASWSVNYADRYIIRYLLTNADVGIYSVGYGIGSKLLLLLGPFITHLSSRLYTLRSEGGNDLAAWQLQQRYISVYTGIAFGACLLFYGCQNWVGHLVLSDQYSGAFAIGPIIAFGYLFLTLINLLEIKWYVFGQTKYILWHYLIGAVVNIGLNFLLVPILGLKGAAFATFFGYLTQFAVVVWLYRRDFRH